MTVVHGDRRGCPLLGDLRSEPPRRSRSLFTIGISKRVVSTDVLAGRHRFRDDIVVPVRFGRPSLDVVAI